MVRAPALLTPLPLSVVAKATLCPFRSRAPPEDTTTDAAAPQGVGVANFKVPALIVTAPVKVPVVPKVKVPSPNLVSPVVPAKPAANATAWPLVSMLMGPVPDVLNHEE